MACGNQEMLTLLLHDNLKFSFRDSFNVS